MFLTILTRHLLAPKSWQSKAKRVEKFSTLYFYPLASLFYILYHCKVVRNGACAEIVGGGELHWELAVLKA